MSTSPQGSQFARTSETPAAPFGAETYQQPGSTEMEAAAEDLSKFDAVSSPEVNAFVEAKEKEPSEMSPDEIEDELLAKRWEMNDGNPASQDTLTRMHDLVEAVPDDHPFKNTAKQNLISALCKEYNLEFEVNAESADTLIDKVYELIDSGEFLINLGEHGDESKNRQLEMKRQEALYRQLFHLAEGTFKKRFADYIGDGDDNFVKAHKVREYLKVTRRYGLNPDEVIAPVSQYLFNYMETAEAEGRKLPPFEEIRRTEELEEEVAPPSDATIGEFESDSDSYENPEATFGDESGNGLFPVNEQQSPEFAPERVVEATESEAQESVALTEDEKRHVNGIATLKANIDDANPAFGKVIDALSENTGDKALLPEAGESRQSYNERIKGLIDKAVKEDLEKAA